MIRWYADNSELYSGVSNTMPDVFLFGGLIISSDQINGLRESFVKVKSEYESTGSFPVKWNQKDLNKYFKSKELVDLQKKLIKESQVWRVKLFDIFAATDMKILMSLVIGHGMKTAVLKKTKPDLTRWAYSNGLMRFALHVKSCEHDCAEIVLDWPDKNDARPFNEEYVSAYRFGKTAKESRKYTSGPLSRLGFSDSPLYASMDLNVLLQASDLLVGAFKETIEFALGFKHERSGTEMTRKVIHLFRGAPERIIGRGLSISPRTQTYHEVLNSHFRELAGL